MPRTAKKPDDKKKPAAGGKKPLPFEKSLTRNQAAGKRNKACKRPGSRIGPGRF